jgi:chaperonin GroES
MDYKPGIGKVLVKLVDAEETTAGGLIIAQTAIEQTNQATVIAVGKGRTSDAGIVFDIPVNVNDVVMFNKGAGVVIAIDGEEMLVLREEDIFAILEE